MGKRISRQTRKTKVKIRLDALKVVDSKERIVDHLAEFITV